MDSPVLQQSWSAATLLLAIKHMDSDAQLPVMQQIEAHLPDDPEELQAFLEARHTYTLL